MSDVLSHFSFDRIVNEASYHTPLTKDEMKEVVVKWSHPYCLSDLDSAAFVTRFLADLQFSGSEGKFKHASNAGFETNEIMRSTIEHYAKNYRLLYPSHTNACHLNDLLEYKSLLALFESDTTSFEARSSHVPEQFPTK